MSHVVTRAVPLDDLEAVRRACAGLGWTLHEGQKTYRWYGRFVGDSPVPEFLFTPAELAAMATMPAGARNEFVTIRLGSCEHAISVPGASYQLALMRGRDGGLVAVWDWYSSGGLGRVLGTPAEPLKNPFYQAYAREKTKLHLERAGIGYDETFHADSGVWEITTKAPGQFEKAVW